MKLRKMIITALATTMLFSLAACGDAANTDDSTETVTTTEAAEATESTEAETTASEDSEGENSSTDDSETDSSTDDSETDSAEDGTPQGDGLVSEEELQKGWAWMKSYGFKIFKNRPEIYLSTQMEGRNHNRQSRTIFCRCRCK